MVTFSEHDDLDKVWGQVLDAYRDITKRDLKAELHPTFDQVISQITEKKVEQYPRVKEYVENVLSFVDKFGSAIASATSSAFPGSGQCFSAVSIVIGAISGYKNIFQGFAHLMEISSKFLVRLDGFLKDARHGGTVLDKRVRASVYDILQEFLLVLGESYNLSRSKTRQIKAFAKVLCFSGDEGVSSALERMKQKICDLTYLQVDLIMRDVTKAANNIERLADTSDEIHATVGRTDKALQDQAIKESAKDNLQRIREKFELVDNGWEVTQSNYRRQRTANTGGWLLQDYAAFRSWADVQNPAESRVIFLEGDPGSGKSFLCSNVIDYLANRYPATQQDALICYYYFPDTQSTDKAIKALLLQLAQVNPSFAEALVTICNNPESMSSTRNLWNEASMELDQNFSGAIYLVLDGLDKEEFSSDKSLPLASIVQRTLSKSTNANSNLRLFISGVSTGLQSIRPGIGDFSIVYLGPSVLARRDSIDSLDSSDDGSDNNSNSSDMLKVAEERLDNMLLFRPPIVVDLATLKSAIPNRLVHGAHGSFTRLICKLEEIENSGTKEDIEDVLERADEDMYEFLSRGLEDLNKELGQHDREVLNEMLIWILGSRSPMDCALLESVLLMKFQKTFYLRQQIPRLYSSILVIREDSTVLLKYNELKEVLIQKHQDSRAESNSKPQLASKEAIEAEVRVAQRLLRTFCGEETFSSLGFEEFFATWSQRQATRIQVDQDMVHIHLVLGYLTAMCEHHGSQEMAGLRKHACEHLLFHLEEIKVDKLSDEEKREIGVRVVRLFREPDFISAWVEGIELWWLGQQFEIYDGSLDVCKAILGDAVVQRALQNTPGTLKWVQGALKDPPVEHLLDPLLCVLGERFLTDFDIDFWTNEGFSSGIYPIYALVHPTQTEGDSPVSEQDGDSDTNDSGTNNSAVLGGSDIDIFPGVSVTELQSMMEWTATLRSDYVLTYAFRLSQLGRIACEYGYRKDGIKMCSEALELDPVDWRLKKNLALALHTSLDLDEVVCALSHIDTLPDLPSTREDTRFEEMWWREILPAQAACNRRLGKLDSAAAVYSELVHHDYGENTPSVSTCGDHAVALLEILTKQKDVAGLVSLIKFLASEGANNSSKLMSLIDEDYFAEDLAPIFPSVYEDVEAFEAVDAVFQDQLAEKRMRDPRSTSTSWLSLQSAHARFLRYTNQSEQSTNAAIEIWERQIALYQADIPSGLAQPLSRNIRELHKFYLEQIHSCVANHQITELNSFVAKDIALANSNLCERGIGRNFMKAAIIRLLHVAGKKQELRAAIQEYLAISMNQWMRGTGSALVHAARLHLVLIAIEEDEKAVAVATLRMHPDSVFYKVTRTTEELDAAEKDKKTAKATKIDDGVSVEKVLEDSPTTAQRGSEWKCTGCSTTHPSKTERWSCRDCSFDHFDAECFKRLMGGDMPLNICGRKHHFHHYIPPTEGVWRRIGSGEVLVGNEWFDQREWLGNIHREWNLFAVCAAATLGKENKWVRVVVLAQRRFRLRREQGGLGK